MASIPTKENVFKPAPSRIEAKADVTTKVARSIIDAEVASREAKTARLRRARLQKESNDNVAAPVKEPATRNRPRAKS
ncbi:hypothetical protein [Aquamicrobium sp. LC103]|uniref:hypothetical protein n=1 Tax=Aquamicrobium sp. LC103 TaxID=1120658 RepID=UPI00063EBC8A|nr:hypothetical protein [Aquamicrobium sp. LC103]TKT81260.1 hypothetical protein XW59_005175 [Aquamicrobium sp. LC103]